MGHRDSPEEFCGADAVACVDAGSSAAAEGSVTAEANSVSTAQQYSWAVRAALFALNCYKSYLSPWFAGSCRFEPTCSRYAYEAIERFGVAAWHVAGNEAAAALPSAITKIRTRSSSGEMGRDARRFDDDFQDSRGASVSTPPMTPLPSGGKNKDKFTPELRILVASLLSMVVFLGWTKYFGPKPPVNVPQPNLPAQTAPATPGNAATAASTPAGSKAPSQTPAAASAATATTTPAIADTQERSIVVENALYRVVFSNRGAVVKSWQLKKYRDDAKPPRTLDLVHPDSSEMTGGWPLSMVFDDPQQEKAANSGLYKVSSDSTSLNAPADVTFTWSDGHLEISKKFHFDHSYVVNVETTGELQRLACYGGTGVARRIWRCHRDRPFARDNHQHVLQRKRQAADVSGEKAGRPGKVGQHLAGRERVYGHRGPLLRRGFFAAQRCAFDAADDALLEGLAHRQRRGRQRRSEADSRGCDRQQRAFR